MEFDFLLVVTCFLRIHATRSLVPPPRLRAMAACSADTVRDSSLARISRLFFEIGAIDETGESVRTSVSSSLLCLEENQGLLLRNPDSKISVPGDSVSPSCVVSLGSGDWAKTCDIFVAVCGSSAEEGAGEDGKTSRLSPNPRTSFWMVRKYEISAESNLESVIDLLPCAVCFGVSAKEGSFSCIRTEARSTNAERKGSKLLTSIASQFFKPSSPPDDSERNTLFMSATYETRVSTSASNGRTSTCVRKTAGEEGEGASKGGADPHIKERS